jgi:hypothetical protein
MYYGQGMSPAACAMLFGVAVLIYLIMRSRMSRGAKRFWSISVFCVTIAVLAVADFARSGRAQRGPSVNLPPVEAPAWMFETSGSSGASNGKNEVASVKAWTTGEDETTREVSVESVRKDRRGGQSSATMAESRTRVRQDSSDGFLDERRSSRPALRTAWRIGGFSLLLLLAYLFLDAGRRPRYIWPRRLAVAATFAAVCLLIWRIGPPM